MRKMHKKIAALMALALVIALAAPAIATAAPKLGSSSTSGCANVFVLKSGMKLAQANTGLADQIKERVHERVRDMLCTRDARFESSTLALEARMDRLADIAALVEADGTVDISGIIAMLADARALIDQAGTTETDASGLFRQIADCENPRDCFNDACATAYNAGQTLRDARDLLRDVAAELREIVQGLEL